MVPVDLVILLCRLVQRYLPPEQQVITAASRGGRQRLYTNQNAGRVAAAAMDQQEKSHDPLSIEDEFV
jgi:hypothetical protein